MSDELIALEAKAAVVKDIVSLMVKRGMDIKALARAMTVNTSKVKSLLNVSHLNTDVDLLVRASIALGGSLSIQLNKPKGTVA